jgi:hypothetical protein
VLLEERVIEPIGKDQGLTATEEEQAHDELIESL